MPRHLNTIAAAAALAFGAAACSDSIQRTIARRLNHPEAREIICARGAGPMPTAWGILALRDHKTANNGRLRVGADCSFSYDGPTHSQHPTP